ncbi:hypothetical protein [Paenibacillus sp. Mc5Re-14]|uniref:hypothetical protein n=1 Tax=Paenibacillus sp. Mc5Re-14 TaxID=1030529 RepID=UPI000AA1BE51|nr:hypothetical protein [Paenibacillus sp. Mc5Re-14]
MDVGRGCLISDKWIPKGIYTGVEDLNGKSIMTSDKITLTGCSSRFAYVGKDMDGLFVLYFGSNSGSVAWDLNEKVVQKNKVRVVEQV